jgi:hypothetical protein
MPYPGRYSGLGAGELHCLARAVPAAHPQRGEDEHAEEYCDADQQQVQQALDDNAEDA